VSGTSSAHNTYLEAGKGSATVPCSVWYEPMYVVDAGGSA